MRIYLAGKISTNCWRHRIVSGLRNLITAEQAATTWPIAQRVIFAEHDYTGPYFISCDHGCAHGNETHGLSLLDDYAHDELAHDCPCRGCQGVQDCGESVAYPAPIPRRDRVVQLCLAAIRRSDVVFGWIDDLAVYGSLFELGYAKAIGKNVVLGFPVDLENGPAGRDAAISLWRDFWFSAAAATNVIYAATPDEALRSGLVALRI